MYWLEPFLVMVTCVSFSSLSEGACTTLGDTTSLVMGLTTRAEEVVMYWLEYLDMLVLCFLRCFWGLPYLFLYSMMDCWWMRFRCLCMPERLTAWSHSQQKVLMQLERELL